jgi:hypothetical protein
VEAESVEAWHVKQEFIGILFNELMRDMDQIHGTEEQGERGQPKY